MGCFLGTKISRYVSTEMQWNGPLHFHQIGIPNTLFVLLVIGKIAELSLDIGGNSSQLFFFILTQGHAY